MEWLNLHASVLDSIEFVGSEPVEQATWLKLLRFTIGQENGGRIEGAAGWKDRKWQQLTRCTRREVLADCDLWSWDGDDLVVAFYPTEKEAQVRAKREAGRLGGQAKTQAKTQASRENGAKGGRKTQAKTQAKTEGKGSREGNGSREEADASSAAAAAETQAGEAKLAERLVDACPKPDKTTRAIAAALECLRRHGGKFDEILEGCRRATAAIAEWPENERIAFKPGPERFFREDQWRKTDWTSRRAAKVAIHKPAAVDIGGRKPKTLDLGIS